VFALLFPEDEKQPKLMEISLPLTLPLLASYVGINSCDVFDTELYKVDPGYARIRRLLGEGPYADAVFCRHPEPVHDSYAEDVQAFLQGKLAIHGPEDPCVGDHEKVVRFRLLYRLDYPSDDRSNLNQCILSVTGGEMCHPWAGPVLAFRLIGLLFYYFSKKISRKNNNKSIQSMIKIH
jgi:hypothetical protein